MEFFVSSVNLKFGRPVLGGPVKNRLPTVLQHSNIYTLTNNSTQFKVD